MHIYMHMFTYIHTFTHVYIFMCLLFCFVYMQTLQHNWYPTGWTRCKLTRDVVAGEVYNTAKMSDNKYCFFGHWRGTALVDHFSVKFDLCSLSLAQRLLVSRVLLVAVQA